MQKARFVRAFFFALIARIEFVETRHERKSLEGEIACEFNVYRCFTIVHY